MFYALATHKLPTPGYKYTHVLSDIQSLNEAALTKLMTSTAVSFAAYPFIRDNTFLSIAAPFSAKAMAPWWSPPNP